MIFDIIDVITIRKLRWHISIHDMCYTAIIMNTYGRDIFICFVLELDRVRVIYLIFPPISFVPELPQCDKILLYFYYIDIIII